MPSTRKFYRTLVTVEVLSEDKIPYPTSLEDVVREIMDGDYSGRVLSAFYGVKSGPEIAKLLKSQGSSPEFFRLDDKGNDLDNSLVWPR